MSVASNHAFASPVTSAEFNVHVKDPIDHLLHCHERIERSLITIQNAIAGLRLADAVLRTEAAAALDYELATLQLLISLHEQDEEKSLFPRLRTNLKDHAAVLQVMLPWFESRHGESDALFNDLAGCIRRISSAPANRADAEMDRLESLTGKLAGIQRLHMSAETDGVIKNCRQYLTAIDLEEMRKEMRNRFSGTAK